MESGDIQNPKMGRPRCFCEEDALAAAARVFWEKSYEGATIADLSEAMGMNRSSIYAAFGDKEGLFLRAIEHHRLGPMSFAREALSKPTLRQVLKDLFEGTAGALNAPGNPIGCLSVQGAIAVGSESGRVRLAMRQIRRDANMALLKRIQKAKDAGELVEEAQPAQLASYITTLLEGLSVRATDGVAQAELKQIAAYALKSLEMNFVKS